VCFWGPFALIRDAVFVPFEGLIDFGVILGSLKLNFSEFG
jgi:hypothetical protein